MSILFKQICICDDMHPRYTNFEIRDPAAYHYISTLEYTRDLLKRQITPNETQTHSCRLASLVCKPLHHQRYPAKRIVIYEGLCFDVAQGRMNGAPNETRTHSGRFASLAC